MSNTWSLPSAIIRVCSLTAPPATTRCIPSATSSKENQITFGSVSIIFWKPYPPSQGIGKTYVTKSVNHGKSSLPTNALVQNSYSIGFHVVSTRHVCLSRKGSDSGIVATPEWNAHFLGHFTLAFAIVLACCPCRESF